MAGVGGRPNEEIARKFNCQIGTYRGHADRDPGHDMTGDLAADFFFYDNSKARHDALLAWFKTNAKRLGATYIITWRRIWSVARASEGVRAYGGSDPHTGHVHISYGTTAPREDDDMPLNSTDLAKIRAIVKEEVAKVWAADVIPDVWGDPNDANTTVQAKNAIAQIGRDAKAKP